jgi:murein DD-endopeptidase MepM/ murein hydrolase activator NlpD
VNPLFLKAIITAFSFRKELKYVIFTFLGVLLLPVVAVILLTQSGINIISDHLATVNVHTDAVQIHDPTGKVIAEINNPMVWPVTGVVTLEFGAVDLPYQPLHTGIDIANPNGQVGDPVTPFMDGTVTYAGEIFWGYGKHIIIDHGNNITSVYAHLDKIFVIKGQKVTTDTVIGREGKTGWATGPHLHFEIRVFGIPVNPRTFLAGNP